MAHPYLRRALAGFLWLLFPTLTAPAQILGSVGVFQEIPADPRAQALGEATVALRGHTGAVDVNPAAIGRKGLVQLGSNVSLGFVEAGLVARLRNDWLGGSGLWISSPGLDAKLDRWAAAYRYKHLGLDDASGWGSPAPGLDEPSEWSHKVAVAYDLRPYLTLGVGFSYLHMSKYVQDREEEWRLEAANRLSLDLGLLYEHRFDVRQWDLLASAGWSLTDFGRPVRFASNAPKDPLNMLMRGGISLQAESKARRLRQPLVTAGLHAALRKTMVHVEEDDSGRLVADGPLRALLTAWKPIRVRTNAINEPQGTYETLGVFEQLVRQVGLEASLLKVIWLRWGYFHEHRYNGDRQYASVGAGLDLYYAAVDYSTVVTDESTLRDAAFWRLTARLPIGPPQDNIWRALREWRRGR